MTNSLPVAVAPREVPLTRAITAAAVDIATLPVDPGEPVALFDRLRGHRGFRWPLEEISHEQYLRDREHRAWLRRFDELVAQLAVIDLDEPFAIVNDDGVAVGVCVLCGVRGRRRKTSGWATTDARTHLRTVHRWDR